MKKTSKRSIWLMGLHTMISEHLDFLRKQLNFLSLFQGYAPHKKSISSKINWHGQINKVLHEKIDYTCLRNYRIQTLLTCEIGSMPYYLFKNGHLRKVKKSELRNALRKIVPLYPSKVLNSSMTVVVIVDFMVHGRKVPNKKLNLCTYHDLASHLQNTFIWECNTNWYYLYILNSIKNDKRDIRGSINNIRTIIHSEEQILLVEMDLF